MVLSSPLSAQTVSKPVLSPSIMGEISEFFQARYQRCWTSFAPSADDYKLVVRVELSRDGALVGSPTLVNQPANPAQNVIADSALRAVEKCSPMRIPKRFSPYFDTWRKQVVNFDRPKSAP